MNSLQWRTIFDQLTHVKGASDKAMAAIFELAGERLADTDVARQAWADVMAVPPVKRRTQFLKAVQLSGLGDQLTEALWRKLVHQAPHVIPSGPHDDLLHDAMEIAATRINDLEWPPLKNQGDDLIPYQQATPIDVGDAWCMAFVYWCVGQAAHHLEAVNPLKATGSCERQWLFATQQAKKEHSPLQVISRDQALQGTPIKPGAIFIHRYGDEHGHTGFVEAIDGDQMTTIEGNSNPFGLPGIGMGVFRCNFRRLSDDHLAGFIQLR